MILQLIIVMPDISSYGCWPQLFHATELTFRLGQSSGWGGGGGGAQRNFKWRGSAPMSDPLPCYKPFLTGKVPIWYNFHWQIVPVL